MTPDEKAIVALTGAIKAAGPHIEALFDHIVEQRDPAAHALLVDLLRASNEMTASIKLMGLIELFIPEKAV